MKDLNQFISEKADSKKKKDKQLRKGEGADDKKYIALMVEYKKLRKNPQDRDKAKEMLDKAMDLAKTGDVSNDAHTAAAYL